MFESEINFDREALLRKVKEKVERQAPTILVGMMPQMQTCISAITCPDHNQSPSVETTDNHAKPIAIRACCEKAKELALEALRRAGYDIRSGISL